MIIMPLLFFLMPPSLNDVTMVASMAKKGIISLSHPFDTPKDFAQATLAGLIGIYVGYSLYSLIHYSRKPAQAYFAIEASYLDLDMSKIAKRGDMIPNNYFEKLNTINATVKETFGSEGEALSRFLNKMYDKYMNNNRQVQRQHEILHENIPNLLRGLWCMKRTAIISSYLSDQYEPSQRSFFFDRSMKVACNKQWSPL